MRALEAVADARAQRRVLGWVVQHWRQARLEQQRDRWLEAQALVFREYVVQSLAWAAWRNALGLARHQAALAAEADAFRARRLLAGAVRRWHRGLAHHRSEALQSEVALAFARRQLASRAVGLWRVNLQASRRHRSQELAAAAVNAKRLGKWAVRRWRQALAGREALQSLQAAASIQDGLRVVRAAWQHWRHLAIQRRRQDANVQHLQQRHACHLLLHVLDHWRARLQVARARRRNWDRAVAFHRRKRAMQVWQAWRQMHTSRRAQLEAARAHLGAHASAASNLALVRRALQHWHRAWLLSVSARLATLRADVCSREKEKKKEKKKMLYFCYLFNHSFIHSFGIKEFRARQLQRGCWLTWRRRAAVLRRRAEQFRMAREFAEARALRRTLAVWRLHLHRRLLAQQREALALWCWSVQTQRRAFVHWQRLCSKVQQRRARLDQVRTSRSSKKKKRRRRRRRRKERKKEKERKKKMKKERNYATKSCACDR